jgi:hypothetical protein
VLFDDASVTMITSGSKMIDFGTPQFSDASEMYIIYTGISIQELITEIAIIHIQLAASLPDQVSKLIVHNSGKTTEFFERE